MPLAMSRPCRDLTRFVAGSMRQARLEVTLNKWVTSVGSLKKEKNQLLVLPPSKDKAAGGSQANRLQTTLLLLLEPGSPGPEQAFWWG